MKLKIRDLRKDLKMSQQDLANKTGFSVRMIIDYEKDDADIPIKKLQKIADALNVNIAELFPQSATTVTKEPAAQYHPPLQSDLIEAKNEVIEILKRENQELRTDKEFFRDLLKSKIINH